MAECENGRQKHGGDGASASDSDDSEDEEADRSQTSSWMLQLSQSIAVLAGPPPQQLLHPKEEPEAHTPGFLPVLQPGICSPPLLLPPPPLLQPKKESGGERGVVACTGDAGATHSASADRASTSAIPSAGTSASASIRVSSAAKHAGLRKLLFRLRQAVGGLSPSDSGGNSGTEISACSGKVSQAVIRNLSDLELPGLHSALRGTQEVESCSGEEHSAAPLLSVLPAPAEECSAEGKSASAIGGSAPTQPNAADETLAGAFVQEMS